MCIRVVPWFNHQSEIEPQENNRFCFWTAVSELGGRYLRVVTLADKLTIQNAFLDRRSKP